MAGDPYGALDAQWGLGGTAPAAPTPPASAAAPGGGTPAAPSAPSGGDPYASLDAQYFGPKGEPRTPAEQRSDVAYGKQSTGADVARSALDAPSKLVFTLLGMPGAIEALIRHVGTLPKEELEKMGSGLGASVDQQGSGGQF